MFTFHLFLTHLQCSFIRGCVFLLYSEVCFRCVVVVFREGVGIVLFWGKRLKLRCYRRNSIDALNVCISTDARASGLCSCALTIMDQTLAVTCLSARDICNKRCVDFSVSHKHNMNCDTGPRSRRGEGVGDINGARVLHHYVFIFVMSLWLL